jgi:hypothetical protein
MSEYNANFKQPPWVMGDPKEVMEWIDATHPSKKDKKQKKGHHKEILKDFYIRFDFDVKQTKVKPSSIFSRFILKITGNQLIEEDFDLIPTAELILRALAKAKFRNTAKIIFDGKVLYDHPEDKTDLRNTIDGLSDLVDDLNDSTTVELNAVLADIEKCTAVVKLKKIHKKNEYSVEIQLKGEIKKELYQTFMNYINDKLSIKK